MDLGDLVPGKALVQVGLEIINKLIPDPEARARAQLELLRQEQAGAFDGVKLQLSAILAEAQSADKWTSRARPSFLYVVYIMLLCAIPMGIVHAISPDTAADIAAGFRSWLEAIPDAIIELFKWVMLGYVGARSWEKGRRIAKGKP
jgi:Holin of 3TMs, for gene-transfer release